MSILLSSARANRIDTEASRLTRQASQLNSQLTALTNEANAFAAFMYTDPQSEFDPIAITKYSTDFMAQLGAIQTTLQSLEALAGVQSGAVTQEQFLAQYVGDIASYSTRFDRG